MVQFLLVVAFIATVEIVLPVLLPVIIVTLVYVFFLSERKIKKSIYDKSVQKYFESFDTTIINGEKFVYLNDKTKKLLNYITIDIPKEHRFNFYVKDSENNLIKQEFFRWDFIYYDYSKKELDDIKAYYTGGSKDGRPIEFVSLKKAALSLSAKWEKFNKSIKNKDSFIRAFCPKLPYHYENRYFLRILLMLISVILIPSYWLFLYHCFHTK